MTRILNAHLLPQLADPHDLAGHTSVIIDVLRASTTIAAAVDAGASAVVPCLTVGEARQLAADRPGSLLGGERGGKKVEGFDLGNSPHEYRTRRIIAQTIVFTTTNGTRALSHCVGAEKVLVGALVNRAALCQAIGNEQRIDLICAGTDGELSLDDAAAAGAIVDYMVTAGIEWCCNDSATLCLNLWHQATGATADPTSITDLLSRSLGGRNLTALNMQQDIEFAAQVDLLDVVPKLDKANWWIRGA